MCYQNPPYKVSSFHHFQHFILGNHVFGHHHFCKLPVKLICWVSLVQIMWIFKFHRLCTFIGKRSFNLRECMKDEIRWRGHMNPGCLETTSFNKSHSHIIALTTFRRFFYDSIMNLRAHIWWAWELLDFIWRTYFDDEALQSVLIGTNPKRDGCRHCPSVKLNTHTRVQSRERPWPTQTLHRRSAAISLPWYEP